jgi:hypothetical protein
MQKFDMERFNLKRLNDMEVKEQYQIKISNRFADLENLDDNDNLNFQQSMEKYYDIKASTTESLVIMK